MYKYGIYIYTTSSLQIEDIRQQIHTYSAITDLDQV